MEPNTQNQLTSAPQSGAPIEMEPAPEKSSTGAIIGSVIVILVLIIGGFYFWGKKLNESAPTEASDAGAVAQSISSSDEVGVIEEELGDTNIDSLDLNLDLDLESEI